MEMWWNPLDAKRSREQSRIRDRRSATPRLRRRCRDVVPPSVPMPDEARASSLPVEEAVHDAGDGDVPPTQVA
ncbi:hypothetical protein GCM10025865_03260 [Paraoerskovia sediminicola]|uniref:Uncharacterized protein n=1 Tax=Paraoerskovia sediminicola TaxID=1138587 RepID=A0ABM8FZ00_9CELL|nr:hypothetical protein GCM10025865_03260 [Paraoerskovia sediminicola]